MEILGKKRNKRADILSEINKGLLLGESNKTIDRINLVHNLATVKEKKIKMKKSVNLIKIESDIEKQNIAVLNLMKDLENIHNVKKEKELEESKNKHLFWFKVKKIVRTKYKAFAEKMNEIWCFMKHEFLTLRNLIFFIHDQFFGAEVKNRKLFYSYKQRFITAFGYSKGEERFNLIVKNVTKGVEMSKKIDERYKK